MILNAVIEANSQEHDQEGAFQVLTVVAPYEESPSSKDTSKDRVKK